MVVTKRYMHACCYLLAAPVCLLYASRIMHWFKYGCYVFFILQILTWTSCQKNEKPSILIIALDKLSSDLVTCTEDSDIEKSGIAMICKESIRFTHSYTTSTHSAAAMGSILTGEYPLQHRLYRSFDRLDSESVSIAQYAKANNYVTSFFSGSPFILKKTGLSYYFDLFDDSIGASVEYDVDFKQQAQSFFQWISLSRQPFFTVIYNSELNKLTNIETDQSSFEKLDEKLHQFFVEMKSQRLWDNTYIFLLGLNGSNKFSRYSLNALTNLHSENTNVATLIKIPRQKGDEGINWKNDLRISLADIGQTLRCLLNAPCENEDEPFPINSLVDLWLKKDSAKIKKNFDRPIIIQATDTMNKESTQHRFSILSDNFNFIQNERNRFEIFNTISDKSELINLASRKTPDFLIPQKYIDYLNGYNIYKNGEDFPKSYIDEHDYFEAISKLNLDYWTKINIREYILLRAVNENSPLAFYYLMSLQKNPKQKIPAVINVKLQTIKYNLLNQNPCIDLISKKTLSKDDLKSCSDDLFLQYLLFTRANDLGLNQEKNKLLYSVMKSNYKNTINRISVNLAHNNAWGLYNPTARLLHPLIFIDPTFFDN